MEHPMLVGLCKIHRILYSIGVLYTYRTVTVHCILHQITSSFQGCGWRDWFGKDDTNDAVYGRSGIGKKRQDWMYTTEVL